MPKKLTESDFLDRFIPEPNTGCFLWTGPINRSGYGLFGHTPHPAHATVLAHRYAWERSVGAIPDGLHVLHRCDTPACVNPDHLWLGTTQDNNADRDRKGRTQDGARERRKTHCRSGHAYDEKNTYWTVEGWRDCRSCSAAARRRERAA